MVCHVLSIFGRHSLARLTVAFVLAATTVAGLAPLARAEDPLETVRRLAKSLDPRDRERGARNAGSLNTPAGLQLLLQLADDEHEGVRHEAVLGLRLIGTAEGRELVARAAAGASSARLRAAACEAAGAYPRAASWAALSRAAKDGHAEVREAACRALGEPPTDGEDRARTVPLLKERFKDQAPLVRCAALESLCLVECAEGLSAAYLAKSDKAPEVRIAALLGTQATGQRADLVKAAIAALADKAWTVRAAAVYLLGRSSERDAVAPLIADLRRETGRLRLDVTDALRRLTGKDIGPDADLWDSWWAAQWNSPNGGGLRAGGHKDESRASYYGVPVFSNAMAFILDLSRSMEEVPKPGEPQRIVTAKKELIAVVQKLPQVSRLTVITFGSKVEALQPRIFPATPQGKALTCQWIEKRQLGGPTNIYDALVMALEDPDVDTIYLVTDGGASAGAFITNEDILAGIARRNRYRRVHVSAIAIGQTRRGRSLMQALADQTGGTYVER